MLSFSLLATTLLVRAAIETVVRPKWFSVVTDDERAREVARLILEAQRLSDTPQLATVHYLLGLVAIEATRQARALSDPILPPGVVPLKPRTPSK
jgi:hypothetical protein